MNISPTKGPISLLCALGVIGSIAATQCQPAATGISNQDSYKSPDGSPIILTVGNTGSQFQTADGATGISAITDSPSNVPSQLQVSRNQLCPLQAGAKISFMEWDIVSNGFIKILDKTPIQIKDNGTGPSSCKLFFSFVKLSDFVEADDLMLAAQNVPADGGAAIESEIDSILNNTTGTNVFGTTDTDILGSVTQQVDAPDRPISGGEPKTSSSTNPNSAAVPGYDSARAKRMVASARNYRMSNELKGLCYTATSRVLQDNGMNVWNISAPHNNNRSKYSTINMYPSDLLDYLTSYPSDVCRKYNFKVFGDWNSKLDPRNAPIGSVMIYRPRYGSGCTVHPLAGHIEVKVSSDKYISDGYRSGQCNFVSAYMVPVKTCN